MTPAPDGRQPWEYADGPRVGRDIPVTSEPREEIVPGVPAPPQNGEQPTQNGHEEGAAANTEVREVQAEDPELSPETNQRLTAELREAVGRDRVRVPADRPHASRGEHPHQHGLGAYLSMHRFQILRAAAIALTFGAIIGLITGYWWMLALAAGVHALGTMTVAVTAVRMTTTSEHPAPDVAAAMAEEGVRNPDEHFSRMVEEFRDQPERGAAEVLSPGFNERNADVLDAPAEAAGEQSSAMTPTGQPTEPAGQGHAPDVLIWSTIAGLFALSIILPAAVGGVWLWLLPAVLVPLLLAWAVMQSMMRGGKLQIRGRAPLAVIVACTTIAVAAFCAVMAYGFLH